MEVVTGLFFCIVTYTQVEWMETDLNVSLQSIVQKSANHQL